MHVLRSVQKYQIKTTVFIYILPQLERFRDSVVTKFSHILPKYHGFSMIFFFYISIYELIETNFSSYKSLKKLKY